MSRRADQVDATRQRITEAAMRLHTTVGPSQASIAAIAEEAGVTRLTVYRHFRDADEIFEACTGHWWSLHPRPDAARWSKVRDRPKRTRQALLELYAWYDETGDDLTPIERDIDWIPARARASRDAAQAAVVDGIIGRPLPRGAAGRRLRAAVTVVASLDTWRALVADGGLSREQAVDLAVDWVLAAAP